MYLSVVRSNDAFTGVQYTEDNQRIRDHHYGQGEYLVWLDYRLTNIGPEDYEDYGTYEPGMESRPFDRTPDELVLLYENKVVTVGSGGDYCNLQEAFDVESKFISRGFTIEVKMLSGYKLEDNLDLEDGDYSHFILTGEDAEHNVAESYSESNIIHLKNVSGFVLDTVINADGNTANGFRAVNSKFKITSGSGIKNTTNHGLWVTNCIFTADSCIFTGCGNANARVVNSSMGDLDNAVLTGAVSNGLITGSGSYVSARNATCRMGETDDTDDVFVNNGSMIYFSGTSKTGGTNVTVNTISAGFGIILD